MKQPSALLALLCFVSLPADSHRLDEYLQATVLSLEPGTLTATLRLVPGVAVASKVIARLDPNVDGTISQDEQTAYVNRVLGDLTLTLDGRKLELQRRAASFPDIDLMRSGLGEIQLVLTSELPVVHGIHRIRLENHHEPGISAYLANTLTPRDARIRIESQERSPDQSVYCVTFAASE